MVLVPDHVSRRLPRNPANDQQRPIEGNGWRRQRNPQNTMTPDDPEFVQRIHDVRHLLTGEWVWDVLVALYGGPLQYTNLLNAIRSKASETGWPGRKHRYLQDSTLNRTLRRLEQGELVRHDREPEFPYHATYELSPTVKELLTVVVPMVEWAETHADLLERARQRRHAEGAAND